MIVKPRHWALLAACVTATLIALPEPEKAAIETPTINLEEFVTEKASEAETAQIRRDRVVLTEREPETGGEPVELPLETIPETEPETTMVAETTETEPETAAAAAYFPIYSVDGDVMDHDLQRFLWEQLNEHGIAHWMPYAMLTAYQESSFDVNQVTNGLDCGLYQYRRTFWPDTAARYGFRAEDLMNPYVQIVVYVKQTAKRLGQGLGVEETISRHKQSDWGPYDQEYVNQVLGHSIEQIR